MGQPMAGKTTKERLAELCASMAEEKNPTAFSNLVKEMTHLLAVGEMSRLLETANRGGEQNGQASQGRRSRYKPSGEKLGPTH